MVVALPSPSLLLCVSSDRSAAGQEPLFLHHITIFTVLETRLIAELLPCAAPQLIPLPDEDSLAEEPRAPRGGRDRSKRGNKQVWF